MILVFYVDILPRRRPVLRYTDPRRTEPQNCQPVGLGIRQRLEKQGVHHAEDGGVRADADREREHDHAGQREVLAEYAEGVAEVLQHQLHNDYWTKSSRAAVIS